MIYEKDFELLQTIAALQERDDAPPTLRQIGDAFGIRRQAIGIKVNRLRELELVQENAPDQSYGVRISLRGRQLIQSGNV